MSIFSKAVKSKSKLRCAIFGASGSGKTYSALAIATGIGGKIALIDSERSSASKYADRFDFQTVDLEDKSINSYVSMINTAKAEGFDVLVIDSLTHAWAELLEEIEKLSRTKYKGNSWSAWNEGTPKQKHLIESILSYPGHVIATMRSKTEWQTQQNANGKTVPIRVGLAPEQGKGIEYEFDILLEMSTDHDAQVIKDRTGKFQDKILHFPGIEFGKELVGWLNDGAVLERKEEKKEEFVSREVIIDKIQKGVKSTEKLNHTFTEEEKKKYSEEELLKLDEKELFVLYQDLIKIYHSVKSKIQEDKT